MRQPTYRYLMEGRVLAFRMSPRDRCIFGDFVCFRGFHSLSLSLSSSGPIPAELGMLGNLQELRLVQNKLTGNGIPFLFVVLDLTWWLRRANLPFARS